ncbi:MAG: hypothetical protein IKF17_05390 [Clostridia bacterium]|nr:hypothetical protein [Clostridia bacterium]
MLKKVLFTIAGIFLITVTILIVNKYTTISLPKYINRMPQVGHHKSEKIWQQAINKSENAKDIIIMSICIGIVLSIAISVALFITKIYKIDIASIVCTLLILIIPVAIYMKFIITYITNNVPIVE